MKHKDDAYIYGVVSEFRKLRKLIVEYYKIDAIDKIASIATCVITCGFLFGIGICFIIFLCNGIVCILDLYISGHLSQLIVAGVLLLVIFAVLLLRKCLFTNPIVRRLLKGDFSDDSSLNEKHTYEF